MQDGIIKGTGNSRYLKGAGWPATYEEFKSMAEAGTLPIDLAGINTAGWQQLATALSKGNLLSDTTAAKLDNVTTVDAALSLLGRFQRGLGNEWVWKREQVVDGIVVIEFNTLLNSAPDADSSYTFVYYDSVSVEEGAIVASGKHTTTLLDFSNNVDYTTAKKYEVGSNGTVYEITKVVALEYSSTPYHNVYGNKLGVGDVIVTTYVNSPDPSAYPPAVSDGYTYTALGQVGGCVHIVRGGYVGTGTYGTSNLTTYTLQNPNSKVVVVYGRSDRNLNLDWFMVFPDILKADAWTDLSAFIGTQSSPVRISIKLSASGVLSINGSDEITQFNGSGRIYTVLEIL